MFGRASRARRAVRAAAPSLLLALAAAAGPLHAEVRPLTLYQKAGRAGWVILGEVSDSDDRFAEVKVLEVIKGTYGSPALRVVYRMENFLRENWQEKIAFTKGEALVLFLKRWEPDEPGDRFPEELKAPDVFAPAFGEQARLRLPEEGRSAYLDAVREFVRVTALADAAALEGALIGFLASPNPHLLQAGLEQVLERRLAGEAQVPLLMTLTESPRDGVRLNALQILRQVAEDLAGADRILPDQGDVVDRLKAKVMGAGGDVFRAEALKVVAVLGGERERAFLERLAKEDRSQLVRYEAARALAGAPPR